MRPIETLTILAAALGTVSAANLRARAPIDTPVGDKDVIALPHVRPAPLKLRTPAYDETCTAAQVKILNKYFTQALKVIETILDPKITTVDSAQFSVFFDADKDPTRFKNVMGIYKAMKTVLTTKKAGAKQLAVSCGTAKTPSDCDGAFAFAQPWDHSVHFCGGFFGGFLTYVHEKTSSLPQFEQFKCKKVKGTDSLEFDLKAANINPSNIDNMYFMPVTTVIHEMSHLFSYPGAAGTIEDCVYGAYGAEYMARALKDAAAGNADNYAWFAITQYIQSFCVDSAADESYFLRSIKDGKAMILSDTFQHQWTAFNTKKTKLVALRKQSAKLQEEAKVPEGKLYTLKQKLGKKTKTAAEEEQIAALQKEIDDIGKQITAVAKKISDLNFGGQYQIDICDTKKTSWAEITDQMAMATVKNTKGRQVLPSGSQDRD